MGEFSITHWLIILAILLLFFGPSKLPGLGASLGKAIRGFKAGLNEVDPNNTGNNQEASSTGQKRPDQLEANATSMKEAADLQQNKVKDPHSKS